MRRVRRVRAGYAGCAGCVGYAPGTPGMHRVCAGYAFMRRVRRVCAGSAGMRRVRRVCAGYAGYASGTLGMRRVRRVCAGHAGYVPGTLCMRRVRPACGGHAGSAPGTPGMRRERQACAGYAGHAPGTPGMRRVRRACAGYAGHAGYAPGTAGMRRVRRACGGYASMPGMRQVRRVLSMCRVRRVCVGTPGALGTPDMRLVRSCRLSATFPRLRRLVSCPVPETIGGATVLREEYVGNMTAATPLQYWLRCCETDSHPTYMTSATTFRLVVYSGFCLSHRQSIKRGRMWSTQALQAQHLCRRQEQQPCCGGRLGLLRQQRPYRLVVRTSRRGRDNPGSTSREADCPRGRRVGLEALEVPSSGSHHRSRAHLAGAIICSRWMCSGIKLVGSLTSVIEQLNKALGVRAHESSDDTGALAKNAHGSPPASQSTCFASLLEFTAAGFMF